MVRWRHWRRYFVAIYLLVLVISYLTRWWSPSDNQPTGCCSAFVRAVEGEHYHNRRIRIAYQDIHSGNDSSGNPILLLHGSPGESGDFERIVPDLSRNHRLIIPDLPGFGHSTRDIPDYSIRAHARYVIELLDEMEVPKVHAVAFSMSGGAVLNIIDIAPERISSLTMLAAIGVQEMELLGDYRLNHAVHWLQLGFFQLLQEGIPQTPTFYSRNIGVSYSRNFYDSDQRPLRDLLKRYDGPMLIIHGRNDFLVPVETAVEHHRLVPQSELVLSDDDHFMVFMKPDYLAPIVDNFVKRVEGGKAITRSRADPSRVEAANLPFDPKNLPKFIGVTAIVVALALAAATLVSEDLTCITAGIITAQGRVGFLFATFACFIGIFLGDLLLFLVGRWLGRPALRRAPIKWFIKAEDVARSSEWFSRQGAKVIFASRFLPGARLPTYFAAGALNTSFWRFTFYFILASAVWTPLLVGLAMVLGGELVESALFGGQSLFIKIVIAAVLIFVLVRLVVRCSTAKGRRLLVSSWQRLRRWEFWPPYVFYLPVICYVSWLMLRHRSVTLFTVANPAIPGGGFIGESKAGIMRGLEKSGDYLPRWKLIEGLQCPQTRVEQAKGFMNQQGLGFPIILKPDAGQRGIGVAVINSEKELEYYLRNIKVNTLIQEYIPGEEFGVFYYRYPDQTRGRIFAITEKQFPSVIGDGTKTLEQLILDDERAVCMARYFLKKHAGDLWKVPGVGERTQLVELGTHCRGAVFLDGGWVKTKELEETIDRICRSFDGFYFGRFDIRTPEIEDFRNGRNFKVIELNGVTSEATSIYDPKNSVLTAYKILFEQWRTAFEIGAQNRARGKQTTPVTTLARWLVDYRKQSQTHDNSKQFPSQPRPEPE
jgi:membrane protein DedA with SNARE-associated domain/pimeloyl-ACP methyl ester carboxylesterase